VSRLGSPAVAPVGLAIERTVKNRVYRYAVRAWHPLVNIPSLYLSREELAHFIGAVIPPAKPRKPARSKI
jgi:hypothetical protein